MRVWCGSVLFFLSLLLLLLLFCFVVVFFRVLLLLFFWGVSISSSGIGVGRKGYGGIFSQEGQSKGDNPFTNGIL